MEVKDYIALYAALVATITGLWQILNGLRDRARLLVTARIDGNCFRIEATDVGRRPVAVKVLSFGINLEPGRPRDLAFAFGVIGRESGRLKNFLTGKRSRTQ